MPWPVYIQVRTGTDLSFIHQHHDHLSKMEIAMQAMRQWSKSGGVAVIHGKTPRIHILVLRCTPHYECRGN